MAGILDAAILLKDVCTVHMQVKGSTQSQIDVQTFTMMIGSMTIPGLLLASSSTSIYICANKHAMLLHAIAVWQARGIICIVSGLASCIASLVKIGCFHVKICSWWLIAGIVLLNCACVSNVARPTVEKHACICQAACIVKQA